MSKIDYTIITNIKYITTKDFDNTTLKYDGFCLVECVNGNRGQLQMMQPVLSRLIDSVPTKLKYMRIDINKQPFIVEQFYVLQSPSYLIFLNGQFIDRVDGIISYNDFSKRINGLLMP
ncbi:MAG: thioredoxin family protein [Bacteroidales bacterium]|nr:thioredoxin family protein [Bacteroidales bacterium]